MGRPNRIIAIVAMDEERAIGRAGELPWRIPEDLRRFRELTTGKTVLMGRKTYWSLPERYRPLPQRQNVVVSRSPADLAAESGITVCSDLAAYLAGVKRGRWELPEQQLWIIGGAAIYAASLAYWDELYLSQVPGQHGGDTFLEPFEEKFSLVSAEKGELVRFERYQRIRD